MTSMMHNKSHFISSSLPCNTKNIQSFILRNPKYMRVVDQFNEDEPLPPHLLFQFFRKVKTVKKLDKFNLHWSYKPKIHLKPEAVKSVLKRHCQTIKKYDALVLNPLKPYDFKNFRLPLKNVSTASASSNKDIKRLLALKTLQNLKMDLGYDKINYRQIFQVLCRLPDLNTLNVTCLSNSLNQILRILEEVNTIRNGKIKFEIFVGSQQQPADVSRLQGRIGEKITHMSFQHISPSGLLSDLFVEKPIVFSQLKTLKLEFSNMSLLATSYLERISEIPNLEKLTVILSQCEDKEVAKGIIRNLKLPTSIESLDLKIPLHLTSLLTQKKRFCVKGFPWRNSNIFEDEPLFAPFFNTFAQAKNLKNIAFEFTMLEGFFPHFTNFIVSILSRLVQLNSLEIQIFDDLRRPSKNAYKGCFDLAPFFTVCSQMPWIEQIEILMPNLLFDGAVFNPKSRNLKCLTIGVDEPEEDKPIKFTGISSVVRKLLRTLAEKSPNLVDLSLDFAEAIDENTLVKRFSMIQRFTKLEALGARFFVGSCSEETAQDVGRVLKSLSKLNMLLLKFFDTDKAIYSMENYIKYHKSIKNMLIQFNDSAWMDNECLVNPLRIGVKETRLDRIDGEDDEMIDENGFMDLEASFDDQMVEFI